MTRLCRLLPVLVVALMPLSAAAQDGASKLQEAAVPAVMTKAVDEVIRPGYRRFHETATGLTGAMKALCATPSADALAKARAGFASAVAAWSEIEIVRVGPALEENRFERILFFPDRKGLALKQVQATIAGKDEKDTTPEGIAGKSVAVQGLTALEYVLYGSGAETLESEADGFRCRFGAAVAGNVDAVAATLSADWEKKGGIADQWKTPGPDNEQFRNGREAIQALLGILVHGVETVRDQRLEAFYKGKDKPVRPKSAIYWRAGLTFPSITANLKGIKALFVASGMEQVLDPADRAIAADIVALLSSLGETAPTVDADVAKAVADPKDQEKLDALLRGTRELLVRLNDGYGGAIGLAAGFSFADGD